MPKEKRLSEREITFCYEFVRLSNAKDAAINAGYSPNGAAVTAHVMLKKPKIKKFLKELFEAEIGPTKILAQQLIRETKEVALSNIEDIAVVTDTGHFHVLPTKEVGRDKLRAVQSYTETVTEEGGSLSVKLYDKLKAIELLMKLLKLFDEDTDGPAKDLARKKSERAKLLELYRKPTGK